MPTVEELGGFYPDDYYSFQESRADKAIKRRLAGFLGLVRETYLPDSERPGRMLDVGCGSGDYIAKLAQRGWQVAGVEPSAAAAAIGRKSGLDITAGSIHDLKFPAEHFDLIRFNHSFEHIPDPIEVLAAARRMLKPGGALFIGVPNTEGLWARLFRSYWWYLGLPVHTYGYNPSNLQRLTRAAGFATETVRYHSEYAGLLGSLQIWANRRRTPRSSSGRILASWVLRLPALWVCRGLDFARAGDCIEYIGRREP
jgi:SAM-dependent methyltransferase